MPPPTLVLLTAETVLTHLSLVVAMPGKHTQGQTRPQWGRATVMMAQDRQQVVGWTCLVYGVGPITGMKGRSIQGLQRT